MNVASVLRFASNATWFYFLYWIINNLSINCQIISSIRHFIYLSPLWYFLSLLAITLELNIFNNKAYIFKSKCSNKQFLVIFYWRIIITSWPNYAAAEFLLFAIIIVEVLLKFAIGLVNLKLSCLLMFFSKTYVNII